MNKEDNKFKSRKFIVWITSTLFLLLSFILHFITGNMAEILKQLAESWGFISMLYIGGNVAQKFTEKK